jgi:hypothetical protein
MLFHVLVDLPLDHVNVPVRRKGVSASARHVVGPKVLCRQPEVRRCPILFPRGLLLPRGRGLQ